MKTVDLIVQGSISVGCISLPAVTAVSQEREWVDLTNFPTEKDLPKREVGCEVDPNSYLCICSIPICQDLCNPASTSTSLMEAARNREN